MDLNALRNELENWPSQARTSDERYWEEDAIEFVLEGLGSLEVGDIGQELALQKLGKFLFVLSIPEVQQAVYWRFYQMLLANGTPKRDKALRQTLATTVSTMLLQSRWSELRSSEQEALLELVDAILSHLADENTSCFVRKRLLHTTGSQNPLSAQALALLGPIPEENMLALVQMVVHALLCRAEHKEQQIIQQAYPVYLVLSSLEEAWAASQRKHVLYLNEQQEIQADLREEPGQILRLLPENVALHPEVEPVEADSLTLVIQRALDRGYSFILKRRWTPLEYIRP